MKRTISRGVVVLGLLSSAASAADLSLVPVGSTTVSPEQSITIEAFVNGIVLPTKLRSYQVRVEVVPLAGAVGTMGLVDPVTPAPNPSIFVDETRADWVFKGPKDAGATIITAVNPSTTTLLAALFSAGDSVTVGTPKYCGTFVFKSSSGAKGDFKARFVLTDPLNPGVKPTQLISDSNADIPFTSTEITINVADRIVNDACADGVVVPTGGTPFSTLGATTDGPALPASCDDGNGLSFGQDVWFKHTTTCNGVLTVSTCGTATFNTRLAVYSGGATFACPTDNTSFLACDDDAAGCAGGTSEVVLPALVTGTNLIIRVGGLGAAAGTGTLNITCIPDLCADAARVTSASSTTGSTRNTALNDNIGPDCGGGPVDSPGAWYVVAGTGDRMTASIRNTASFNTRLTVYRGGCGALTCVGAANVTGNGGESVNWCSTAGVDYRILVHGVGGASGTFTLDVSSQSCNDSNQCTDDSCSAGACVNTANFDTATQCCAPSSRTLTTIDDGNACTNDVCNATTGAVTHPAKPNGPVAGCDDGNPCTTDSCLNGICASTDVNGRACSVANPCPGDATCVNNACECVAVTFELIAAPGAQPMAGCYSVGEVVTVRVELGPRGVSNISPQPIIGAQFFLAFDPTTFTVLKVEPGVVIDPTSPFSSELTEAVNAVAGTIDYLVVVNFGETGTRDPATVAVITFRATAECTSFVAFRLSGPNGESNRLSLSGGSKLDPSLINPAPYKVNSTAPALTACPADQLVSPDPRLFTTRVSWTSPTASDGCEPGGLPVTCVPAAGSLFSAGTTPVTCRATDSCGLTTSCTFDVIVAAPELVVDVDLSPSMSAGPISRCITFDLWDCNAPSGSNRSTVKQALVFNNGQASAAAVPIPGGPWTCLTVRDELHSLRSTAANFTTTDGILYAASFLGSRASGGHWLIGGNLNDDAFIDILDFGVFFPRFLTQAGVSTPCGTVGPHADFNGDGQVDLSDLVFVSGNSLLASEPGCCGAGITAGGEGPITSITVRELRSRGLGYMAAADVNRDGVLDFQDIFAVFSGDIPPTGSGTEPTLRELSPTKDDTARGSRPHK